MHLSLGFKRFLSVALPPSPPSPREPVPKPSRCFHNDCVWVTFSNPSPLRPPTTSTAPAAPLALLSPRGPHHRLALINPRRAPECPSQPHVPRPPGRVPACLRGQCQGPSAVPAVPDAARACGARHPHGGHPDFEGQLPPGAPGELQAGRSRGHLWATGRSGVPGLWDVGAAACCGMGLRGWICFGSQHQEPLGNPRTR